MLARQLGFVMLTQTMERRHQIALSSYDRLFPNQDTLPRGGFGNLIALPLQLHSREKGGSVFLTKELTPAKDQWKILDSIKRVSRDQVDKIVSDAYKNRTIINVPVPSYDETENEDPWTVPPSKKRTLKEVTGPFPESIKIVRANLIFIEKFGISSSLLNRLRLLAAFQNPEFFKNQAMRLPVYDKPRVIDCSEDAGKYLALPRGCLDDVSSLMKQYSIRVEVEDVRYEGKRTAAEFSGSLWGEQESTVNKLLLEDIGLLSAPTAFGKTVVAAAMIARRGVNSLILVHRQQLIDQWKERLQSFLSLPSKSIGQIGAGKKKPTGIIDIAMIQSLVRQGSVDDLVANYGQVIVDECHHVSAFSFEQVLKGCKAKYILGLTATPRRKDGHHPIIIMQCGKIIQADKTSSEAQNSEQQSRSVVVRETNFSLPSDSQKPPMHEIYQALSENKDRSEAIASDVMVSVKSGHYPLVLTERVEHLEKLEELLRSCSCPIVLLKGGMGKRQRQEAMKRLETCAGPRVILATGRYIGEGFDDPKLDTLFLALPISWTGTLQQYVGRLHRTLEGKNKVTVYDYVDSQVPTLQRMFKKRMRGYKAFAYEIRKEDSGGRDQLPIMSSGKMC
jgi:superfamily II DNA or RNA helicase